MHLKISVQICNRRLVTLSVLLQGINHYRGPLHEMSSGVLHFDDSRSDCNNICLFSSQPFFKESLIHEPLSKNRVTPVFEDFSSENATSEVFTFRTSGKYLLPESLKL
jgi:hypothetical protein